MNIANLSPAERMKAFGLVGLIIIALFFAVHTLLGAVAPKKNTNPQGATTTAAGVPGAPPPVGGAPDPAQVPAAGADAFPLDKASAQAKKSGAAERDVPDPFVQIREPDNPASHNAFSHLAKKRQDPDVEIRSDAFPAPPRGGLPALGSMPFGGNGPAPVAVAPPEPEIRVIGLVHGDTPVATLSVGGAIQIARPGDPLAKGYRLMKVTEEAVTVRHEHELTTLRVGGVMNAAAVKP